MKWKKRGLTFLLDLIFATVILMGAYFSRILLKNLITKISELGPAVYEIQEKLAINESLTQTNQLALEQMDKVMFQANLLNNFLLPVVLVLAFLLTQMFVWKILNGTPKRRFIIYSIIPYVLFLLFGSMFLEFLMWVFAISEFNFAWFIVLGILVILLSYYALLWNVHWKENIKSILTRKQVILPYLVLFLATLLFLMILVGGFVGLTVGAFSWWIFLLIVISLIIFNFARTYYIRKVKCPLERRSLKKNKEDKK